MPDPSPQELLAAALQITEAAAAVPMRYFRTGVAVEDKPDASPVTVADRETEAHIRAAIEARFPAHGIFGEEYGAKEAGAAISWIIDPIDGTKSFISGSPLFGMLVGVARGGRPEAGVIRMPALRECFTGARGAPATLNGRPIRCRPAPALADARIYLNEVNLLMTAEPDRFARLMQAGHLRRFANDCYSFALLAMGQIDLVIDYGLKPHDYMAVAAVVEAAGGTMTDWRGETLHLGSDGNVLATGGGALHEAVLDLLR